MYQGLIVTKMVKIAGIVAMLSLPDSAVKHVTSKGINWYLDDLEGSYGSKVSTTLMKKCVNGDREPFTREDLDAINPLYGQTLDQAVQLVFSNRLDPENDRDVESMKRWSLEEGKSFEEKYKIALQRAEEARAILNGGSGVISVDTWDEKVFLGDQIFVNDHVNTSINDIETADKSSNTLMADFSRALGSFSIKCAAGDKPCYVVDYFDFEVTPNLSHSQRLSSAINMFEGGYYDASSQFLGQMFCEEGENEQPTETSIPIEIEVSRPTLEI